jgi:endonuclease-3 related protein
VRPTRDGEKTPTQTIRSIYRKLSRAWGRQHWWPAESPFEVIVGAILVQNTAWTNVERAMVNLRAAEALRVDAIRTIPVGRLEQLVRPSGYFRQKAVRLKEFVRFLDAEFSGSVEVMLAMPTSQLRGSLLAQKGIGPETADSILLYAGQHPVFVVDAYTRRVLERHDVVQASEKYDEVKALLEAALPGGQLPPSGDGHSFHDGRPAAHPPSAMSTATRPALVQVYNEMHGLFVQLGKHFCTKREPRCEECPLGAMLRHPDLEDLPRGTRARASKSQRTT